MSDVPSSIYDIDDLEKLYVFFRERYAAGIGVTAREVEEIGIRLGANPFIDAETEREHEAFERSVDQKASDVCATMDNLKRNPTREEAVENLLEFVPRLITLSQCCVDHAEVEIGLHAANDHWASLVTALGIGPKPDIRVLEK
ncbi:hypothetical protein EBT31_11400 [bacterium]|nr:hypothetical protein [bacterium]